MVANAVAIVFSVWAVVALGLAFFLFRSNRAQCSESDAIVAEAEAAELRRMGGAHV